MLKSKKFVAPMALLALAAFGGGSGDDDDTGDAGTGTTGGDSDSGTTGGGETEDVSLTLVPVTATDTSNPILTTHDVYLLNSVTGEAIPGFEEPVKTDKGAFKVEGLPADIIPAYYVVGSGTTPEDTYDSVSISPYGTGSKLLLASSVGLAGFAEMTGGYVAMSDRAAMSGAVYNTPGGPGNPRTGTYPCAKIYLDGSDEALNEDQAQRYNGSNRLPTTTDKLTFTSDNGSFYFGNISKGDHYIEASFDDGKTKVGKTSFNIVAAREDARGPAPFIIYLVAIDLDSDTYTPDTSCEVPTDI